MADSLFDISSFNPLTTGNSTPATNIGQPSILSQISTARNNLAYQGLGGGAQPIPTPTVIAPAPVSPLTNQSLTFGSNNQATQSQAPSVNANYQLQPGETIDAYNKRVAAYQASGGATQTGSGGYVTTDGNGTATTQPNFSIDTSGPVDSSVLGTSYAPGDVTGTQSTYANFVNGLSAAQQYSPEYISALQGKQAADAKQAELQTNFYTGNNLPGDTLDYAQGATAKAQAINSLGQLSANQALDVQTLLRNGNIAAAQALVQAYSPTSVSPGSSLVNPVTGEQTYSGLGGYQAVQAIQTVSNLAQTYPDAGISPTDTLQTAQQKASQAPSFASRQLVQVTLPGGGIEFVNKNQLQTNADGSFTVATSGQAATANAASSAIADLTKQKADTVAAVATADQNFPLLLSAVQKAGVNNSAPLVNQLEQKFGSSWSTSPSFAALNTLVPSLQTEYARIIARGGTVDDNTRKSAQAIVNGTYSLSQLQSVYNTLKAESSNVIAGYDTSIAQQQAALGNSPTTTGTSKYDF